jgi:hypothetical protein
MKKLAELKEEIEKMISIYFSAKSSFNDNLYLLNPDTTEEKVVAYHDLFIKRARYALGVLSILEISKLFGGNNDAFSFNKFLNKLKINYNNSEWKDKLSLELILEWNKELDEQSMKDCISKVKSLRNQYFAHSDRNPENFENLIMKSEEMIRLLKFCETVLLKISVDIFGQYYYSFTSETEKASGILQRLSIYVKKNKY